MNLLLFEKSTSIHHPLRTFLRQVFKDQIVIYDSTVPDKSYQTLSMRRMGVNVNSIGAFTYPQCKNRTHLNLDSFRNNTIF